MSGPTTATGTGAAARRPLALGATVLLLLATVPSQALAR